MLTRSNLSRLPQIGQLSPDSMAAFQAYDKAALAEGAIPKKYKELMAIAVALTAQCARSASHGGAEGWSHGSGTGRDSSPRRGTSRGSRGDPGLDFVSLWDRAERATEMFA
jgi:hypothetical protein